MGQWLDVPGDIKTRFPIRIYSQKQIFELAKKPQALLGIIDASPEVDFASWASDDQRIRDDYHKLLAEADGYNDQIADETRIAGTIQDLERRIASAETLSASPDVLELRRLQGISSVLHKTIEESTEFEFLVQSLNDSLRIPPALQQSALKDEPTLTEAVQSALITMSDTRNLIGSLNERVRGALSGLQEAAQRADYEGRIATLQKRIADDAGEESSAAALGILAQVSEWNDQLNEAKKEHSKIDRAKRLLTAIEPKVREQRAAIAESRKSLSRRRSEYLTSLEASTPNVEVRLHPMGNSSDLEENWRRLVKKESAFEKAFSTDGFFKDIPDGRNPQFGTKIEALKKATIDLSSGAPAEDAFRNHKIDGRLVDHLRGLSRSDLEEIDTWFPEDSVHVRYKSDDNSPWSPISEGSPGQRTAALLAFVLSMGTEPLILDQPEDDLENQLIYSLVVGTLRSIKSCRQVIVVTHNANIVVNGNAENVIVLQRSGDAASIQATGALEKSDVRAAVCQIMEGGETAFTKRFERLGIKLPSHIGALR